MQTKAFSEINLRNRKVQNAYSTLIGNIHIKCMETQIKSIVITSCNSQEGKTLLATDLSISLAIMGKKVLLIDMDFRKTYSKKNDKTRVVSTFGIYQYLTSDIKIDEILYKTNFDNLYYINSGRPNGNPMSIICSDKLSDFIKQEEENFDYIIIDSSPLCDTPDSVIVSVIADAAVLVARKDFTKLTDLVKAQERLSEAGANVIGTVLNRDGKIRRRDTAAIEYYHKVQTVKNISVGSI